MDVSHLLDGLNPAQREAVSAAPGHYLVLAGAGSGKTRVLTHRIAWLHEVFGVPLHGILAVTFTNKAAGEMRGRIAAQLGGEPRGAWIGTFHGLAHRLLRLHWQEAKLPEGFQVLDSDDQLRLVKRVVQQLELDDGQFPPRQLTWWINAQKDEGRRPQHIQPAPHDPWGDVQLRVYTAYEERCQRAGLVDFAELLLRAHELLRDTPALLAHYRHRFGQILVDEFQDTNAIQYGFIRLLAGSTGLGRFWWTNSKTPTPSSMGLFGCWPGRLGRSLWWAMTTKPSTAGAARKSKMCSVFCAIFLARTPSGWNKTTVPVAPS